MKSKDKIFAAIREGFPRGMDMPSFDGFEPARYSDRLEKFVHMLELVGGHAVVVGPEQVLHVEEKPDETVVHGKFGVAENGCIWVDVPQDGRASLFTAESLAIILDRKDILNNMHEAYELVAKEDYVYGCFMCGPSKTADIAQALVMGAQAARELTVYITQTEG